MGSSVHLDLMGRLPDVIVSPLKAVRVRAEWSRNGMICMISLQGDLYRERLLVRLGYKWKQTPFSLGGR